MTVPVAVLASGGGTNLQALLDHEGSARSSSGEPLWRVALVLSDREGAGALDRAREAGRRVAVVPVASREPQEVGRQMLAEFEEAGIRVVALAGFLRLVPPDVVEAYRGRVLNVHPSLLPAYGGKGMYGRRVHDAVLGAGGRVTGVTVHFVDERYDRGPILAQWPVPVRSSDTAESLAERVRRVEHRLYPLAVDHLCGAVAEGTDPERFELPGEAFLVTTEPPGQEMGRQIQQGFGGR